MPKQTWSTVKSAVSQLSNRELLRLVGKLYRLSNRNHNFLHARYADTEATMEVCKKIIAECLYRDVLRDPPLQVAKAKKAVANFCTAIAEPVAHADLMLFFGVLTPGKHYRRWGCTQGRGPLQWHLENVEATIRGWSRKHLRL